MKHPKDMDTTELIDEIITVANRKLKKAISEAERIEERVNILREQRDELEELRNKVIGAE